MMIDRSELLLLLVTLYEMKEEFLGRLCGIGHCDC